MMLIMVTSPIESFFMRSLAANWLPDCIHNGKLTCQRTIQPGSRLKLVLGVAGCAFVTPLATKDKREYGHRCDQQDGEHLSASIGALPGLQGTPALWR